MNTRVQDPRHLDVAAAAAAGSELAGHHRLTEFDRLAEGAPRRGDDEGVDWSARFERRRGPGGEPQNRLQLRIQGRVWRDCQRCLQAMPITLAVDRCLRFAADEATAAALDVDSDDDVLALSRRFDLLELVEDELLLALPLVPMHEHCPHPLAPAADREPAETPAHPFAALAALKRGRGP
jgi:uncharacterized protein